MARTEDKRCSYVVLVGRPEEWNHLEDRGIDGSMILKWVFKNWVGGVECIVLAQK